MPLYCSQKLRGRFAASLTDDSHAIIIVNLRTFIKVYALKINHNHKRINDRLSKNKVDNITSFAWETKLQTQQLKSPLFD
jgi:hypothetical protein